MQYNNVSLGFAALAAVLILKDHEFLGSISYCLALNFKQMTLYYAPAFGIFLLARCLYQPNAILHLAKLALAVIATFVVLWAPFCLAPREDGECLASLAQGASLPRWPHSLCSWVSNMLLHVQWCTGSSQSLEASSKTRSPTFGASQICFSRSDATSVRPCRCGSGM